MIKKLANKISILIIMILSFLFSNSIYALCEIVPKKLRQQCLNECTKYDDGSEFLNGDFFQCQARFMDDVKLPPYDSEAVEKYDKEFQEKLRKENEKEKKRLEEQEKKNREKQLKIYSKCANKAADAKNEVAAEGIISSCLELNGYYQ